MPAAWTFDSTPSDLVEQRSSDAFDPATCIASVADLHRNPDAASECVSQCLFGETLSVIAVEGDWARVRTGHDDYPGHVRTASIRSLPGDHETTCIVIVRTTLVFVRPDIKSRVLLRIPLGAGLAVEEIDADGDFARIRIPVATDDRAGLPRVGHVWREHIRPTRAPLEGTLVDLAQRLFSGAPYRWGGRTPDGVDCSGLLQGTARMLGIALPRDSGQQEAAMETVIPMAERTASDAVFWPGHVALLIDSDTLFHATAHSLATAVEPLINVIERAGEPSSIRRLPTAI